MNDSFDDMEIAPKFTVKDWKALDLNDPQSDDWDKAVKAFQLRIDSRFIEPADILLETEKWVGFAVLALDFIVIETIQHFRYDSVSQGNNNSESQSRQFFVDFIREEPSFASSKVSESLAHTLYSRYRNSIFHQGETKGDFRVRPDGPLINRRGKFPYDITINRTLFHEAVKKAFERYCRDLMDNSKEGLRKNFRKKMDFICGIVNNNL